MLYRIAVQWKVYRCIARELCNLIDYNEVVQLLLFPFFFLFSLEEWRYISR